MKHLKGQFNFNSVLILVVTALISFGIKKLDESNTRLIELSVRMNAAEGRLSSIEGAVFKPRLNGN